MKLADSIAPDQVALAQTAQMLRAAEAASTEVKRIRDESGATTADPDGKEPPSDGSVGS